MCSIDFLLSAWTTTAGKELSVYLFICKGPARLSSHQSISRGIISSMIGDESMSSETQPYDDTEHRKRAIWRPLADLGWAHLPKPFIVG